MISYFFALIKNILEQILENHNKIEEMIKQKICVYSIEGKDNLKGTVTLVSNDIQGIRFLVVFLDSDGDYDSTLSKIKNFYKSLTNCDRIV